MEEEDEGEKKRMLSCGERKVGGLVVVVDGTYMDTLMSSCRAKCFVGLCGIEN